MNRQFDEITLSSYVDGELDPDSMREVEAFIENDANARKYVVNAIKTTARLRQTMNKVIYEEVPEHLIRTILAQRKKDELRFPAFHPLFRMAAALLLVLVGFGVGSFFQTTGNESFSTLSTPFPASYSRVVEEALEHNLSGTPRQWQSPQDQVVITVIPVKTYRDKNGQYFREYRLEVSTEKERRKINGLAYRQNGKWKTKAVFFQ
jgi:hypothetical protein